MADSDTYEFKAQKDVMFDIPQPFNRTGYQFKYWTLTSEDSGESYDGSEEEFSEDTDLYAQWMANTYTVRFNANGGTGTMNDQTFTYDQPLTSLTSNAFTKAGYSYRGWARTSDAAQAEYSNGQQVRNLTSTNNEIIDLYAIWEVNTYTVTFNNNFPSAGADYTFNYSTPEPVTKNEGQEIGTLPQIGTAYSTGGSGYQIVPSPTQEGVKWKFLGWWTAKSGGTQITESSSFSSSTTVYAHWERRKYIRFNRQCGRQGETRYIEKVFLDNGLPIGNAFSNGELPSPGDHNSHESPYNKDNENWDFLNWYTAGDPEADGGGRIYRHNTAENYYILKYYSNTYMNEHSGTVQRYKQINISLNAEDTQDETNYYWTQSGDDRQEVVPVGESKKIGNTATVWNADLNEGSGGEVKLGGVPITKNFQPPNTATIIYAHWVNKVRVVSWNTHGGEPVPENQNIPSGTAIGALPADPQKEGYDFDGWWTAETGGTQVETTTKIQANVTFHAHWSRKQYTVTYHRNFSAKEQDETEN